MQTRKQKDATDLRVIADTLDAYRGQYPDHYETRARAGGAVTTDILRAIAEEMDDHERRRLATQEHFHTPKWHKVFRDSVQGPATKVIDSESRSWFVSMKVANVYATRAEARSVAYALWRELDKQLEEATAHDGA